MCSITIKIVRLRTASLTESLPGRLREREVQQEARHCVDLSLLQRNKYSLLIIIGRTAHHRHARHVCQHIQTGIRSWGVDLEDCDLDVYLQEFLSHHTASFKGAGHKCLRHNGRGLDIHVVIAPSQEQAHSEVSALLSRESAHKLLILAGQSVEDSGDLLFHRGLFSPKQLKDILDQFPDEDHLACRKLNLTLCCPNNAAHWRKTLQPCRGPVTLHINPPEVLPAMSALGEFTSFVSGTLSPLSPFELLPPPATVGFLKLSRPCCYVFPAGHGDCAFFAVNGFTMLLDGGSDPQACFWKLVRHLDRIDAVVLTHVGTENLTGVNSFLERKVAESELASDVKEDSSKRLISPELGVVFFNAPSKLQVEQQPCVDSVLKSTDQAALTVHLLKRLDIRPQPMFRPEGVAPEPITLFQKMGVGQLDLYILNPAKNSQEYQTFMQHWPDPVSFGPQSQALPLTALESVSALLVWHPACPQEKVVRVLFPGVTPQAKLLQGLDKLKTLAFLQKPTVTTGELEKLADTGKTKRAESQNIVNSNGKEVPPKHGKDAKVKSIHGDFDKAKKQKVTEKNSLKKASGNDGKKNGKTNSREENGVVRNGTGKKELPISKPKNDNKQKKEAKNDSKAGPKKTQKLPGKNVHSKTESKPDNEAAMEVPKPDGLGAQEDPMNETRASKISTPEDMTADFLILGEEMEKEAGDKADKGKQTENQKQLGCSGDQTVVQSGLCKKPAKVVGFPSPLKETPKDEQDIQLDLTPTEYTLLDGALRTTPPSRSSPENQASPDEETVENASPDSRPNSAGHTPYCLSPDDVWCNRDTLSRLQAQQEPTEVTQPKNWPRNAPENPQNPREKHLSFSLGFSLAPLKDGASDPSPSVANTSTSTHSMPAEVSSPQSTEVDESLSMSLEQGPAIGSQRELDDGIHHPHTNGGQFVPLPMKKPVRSLGSEMGRPPAPSTLHFEASAVHDVDLCLVSPCEFKHFKAFDSNSGISEASRGAFGPQHHSSNHNTTPAKDVSPSESNTPVCMEDCPSTTADGVLDSDEEESCSMLPHLRSSQALPRDPLPARLRDSPPPPPRPDATMPVPQSDAAKKVKSSSVRGKTAGVMEGSQRASSFKSKAGSGVLKGRKDNAVPSRTSSASSQRPAPAKSSVNADSKLVSAEDVSVYVDLAYVPSGASSPTVSVDFFKSVRSSCYIISGDCPEREELMRHTLDALLDGKSCWPGAMQVTLIPTLESGSMQDWYQQTLERQRELGIVVLGSNSTVAMQDETFPACKIEF
uniref:microtubule-associated protein 1B-like n=1 Tax=Doryrhamphus excisus TaxID=161450 RepID=UPI0025ADFC38|nr:microtubule-associated protein 1B-like [Doryrhamphus excisus]